MKVDLQGFRNLVGLFLATENQKTSLVLQN